MTAVASSPKNLEDMVFDDLTPIEVKVRIENKPYVLREATGAAAVQYRNASMRNIRMADGKVVGMGDIGELEPLLVSLCLFSADADGKFSSVTVAKIKSWPARVVKDLFNRARAISDLEEAESPQRTALLKALNLSDSPVKLPDFRKWAKSLVDRDPIHAKEFQPLLDLVGESQLEDVAKNEPSATTASYA